MLEALREALTDSVKLIPFLFLTYLVMGFLERATGEKTQRRIKEAGKSGPIWGGLLGAFPQCGFSAAASYFYIGRIITLGTLIAVYMSTSDEMIPILLSEKVAFSVIAKILIVKVAIGMVSGFLIETLFGWMAKRKRKVAFDMKPRESCSCTGGLITNAAVHTLKTFFFVFIVSVVIGLIIFFVGEDSLNLIFSDIPVLGEVIAGLVGLIPNCAASVVITQLYLDGVIGAGAMMSGLLVSAGVGLLVLFKENKNLRENLTIVAMLYIFSVAWGTVIEVLGIAF